MRKSIIAAVAAAFTLAACAATTTAPPPQAGVPGPQKASAERPAPKKPGCGNRDIFYGGGGGPATLADAILDKLFDCN